MGIAETPAYPRCLLRPTLVLSSLALSLAAPLTALSGLAAAAERSWLPAEVLAPDTPMSALGVTVDANGGAAVLTSGSTNTTRMFARPPGARFRRPVTLDWLDHHGVSTSVLADQGRLVTLFQPWGENRPAGPFQYVTRATAGARVSEGALGDPGGTAVSPVVKGNAAGQTLAAWWNQPEGSGPCCDDLRIAEAVGGEFHTPYRLPLGSQMNALPGVNVALADSGAAIVSWAAENRFWAAVRGPAGGFAPAEPIQGGKPPWGLGIASVAVDQAGGAVLAAEEGLGDTDAAPQARVVVATRPPGGSFAVAEPVSDPQPGRAPAPAVAAGPSGDALVAWTQMPEYGAACCGRLFVSERLADGRFGPATLLAAEVANTQPALGMDRAGNAILAWISRDGSGWRIFAAHRPPGQRFSSAHDLSGPIDIPARQLASPSLAVGGPGNAVVAWQAGADVQRVALSAAIFDVAPPIVSELHVAHQAPARVTSLTWEVSERTTVTISIRRRGTEVRRRSLVTNAGVHRVSVRSRGLRAGVHVAFVTAEDRLGHQSMPQQVRFRVPR